MLPGITPTLGGSQRPSVQQVIFLSGGVSWLVPSDWTSDNNRIICFGAGGGGGSGVFNFFNGVGGAGASCCQVQNVTLTPGAGLFFSVPGGGPGGAAGGHDGAAGGSTWIRFDGANTLPTAASNGCLAVGGPGGSYGNASSGGTTAGCIGQFAWAGGGSILGAPQTNGLGGGGCGGVGAPAANTSGPNGGAGGGAGGGGGGGMDGGGGNGATYTITGGGIVGPGGGAGGGNAGANGPQGGYVGGGGGGAGAFSGNVGGNGGAGGIVILYGP